MSNDEETNLIDDKKPMDKVDSSEQKSIADKKNATTYSKKTTTNWSVVFLSSILLTIICAIGFFARSYYNDVTSQLELLLSERIAATTMLQRIQANEAQLREVEQLVNGLQQQVDQADVITESILRRIKDVSEEMAKARADTRDSYVLAEAEYLLKLAEQRLVIERNTETALRLMHTAQVLLGGFDDGRLLHVHKQIAADIQRLSVIPNIDVVGLQAKLLALDEIIDALILPARRFERIESNQDPEEAGWISTLSEFIRIRKVDVPITPLVSAADVGRAKEVLRLSLEQIKAALIREDQLTFDAAIKQAKRLTINYFDIESVAGQQVLSTLESISTQNVTRDIPDAASGLRALKSFRELLTQERITRGEVTN